MGACDQIIVNLQGQYLR